jgi:hypothetical protein
MDGIATPSKIDLKYSDQLVIFRVSDCCISSKHSLSVLKREQAKIFINRLREKEKLTWKKLSSLDRKEGLTVEKLQSQSYKMIDSENNSLSKLTGEKYYFHMRIEANGLFRIFGYQWNNSFFITHIDPKGIIHH